MVFPAFPTPAYLPGTAYPERHAPEFVTARYVSLSGKRTEAPKSPFPRWNWSIPFAALRSGDYGNGTYQELETLVGFFNARKADGQCFAYQDPEDHTATDQPFGLGDGTTTIFQLYRAFGGFTEPVYVPDITDVQLDAVVVNPSSYTVGDTGAITFDVAPGNGEQLTWNGEFSFLCRFDADTLDLQRFMKGLSQTGDALKFSSELAVV